MNATDRPELPVLPERCRFGPGGRFELRPRSRELLEGGTPVALGGRAFDLLLALLMRRDRVVPRGELIDAVWPGRVIEENNLSVQVTTLRRVLGSELLVTVPGRGYRFAGRLDADEPPAPLADSPVHSNLPVAQALLIGRSDELAKAATLIEQHRLLTLVGPGGVGKTRLAQALLALRGSAFADGACWVELAMLSDAAALPGLLATALRLKPAPGDAVQGLVAALAGRRLLLALDNAEHMLDDVARLVHTLLARLPGLRVVVTSQAPLRLAEERVQRLAGLEVPQGALPAQAAQAFGAVALFAERAAAFDHRFVLADEQVPAVVELCRQLDGNALAIELAASRVPLLGLDALLAVLPERLRILTGNRDRTAPPRQQTLRAALEWSHGLLPPREQRLFRRLAVIADSASLALVQALDDDNGDPYAVLDSLDELVQRSLVEVNVEAVTAAPRYRLLASPRALAAEQLQVSGEAPVIQRRHALAVCRALDAAACAMEAGRIGVDAWRRAAQLEIVEARAAIAWATGQAEDPLALTLATALLRVLPAPLHDERQRLADLVERLEVADGVPAWLACRAATAVSQALAAVDLQRSRAAGDRALVAARRLPDDDEGRWCRVLALTESAGTVIGEAEAGDAEALLAEALAIESPSWPPVRRRCTLTVRAGIAAARGDHAMALSLDRELLRLSREAGDWSPMTQINIADGELRCGDASAAVATGQALVQQLSAQHDDDHLAYARLNLAAALLALEDTKMARQVLRACLAGARRIARLSWWCDHGALLAAHEGRLADAAVLLAAADEAYRSVGESRQHNEALEHERTLALGAIPAPPTLDTMAPTDESLLHWALGNGS